ncbi:hypothetical protein MSBR3_0561 [Methanosarcina barkeri 3]|uniref:Uncharacterized protein n=1 Tax=Methanosarcina barkeri 3 TaxID=1434107 RepID=A0A0E3SFM6_METBA|nr:hypothetical protein [Methanosarcina barkeri]AKB81139.1 hypothetical protein MSBR3_0561 [Methanosarcina barkeri 3]
MDSTHPFEIVPETDDSDVDIHRTLSITKYVTNVTYDSDEIKSKFFKNKLCLTDGFGCVYPKEVNGHIHALFGKLGVKTLLGLDTDSDNNNMLRRYNFGRVIVATMYVDHFPEDNKLSLIVFNSGKISKDLWQSTYRNLLNVFDLKPVKFSDEELRKICFTKYRDDLLEIKFDPASEKEFGNVKLAEYKSIRSKKFNPNAKKIQEIIDNNEIKVNRFKSDIYSTYPNLDKSYPVAFTIDVEGKVTLEFPKISWSLKDTNEIEEHYYSFASKIYDEIISKEIYAKEAEEDNSQKSLFDF